MTMIELFNKNVSDSINKDDDFYKTWFGDKNFVPDTIVIESEDFNCGALCNELEYARLVADSYVRSLNINEASGDELATLINTFINLPRRGRAEDDITFRARFNFLVADKTNLRRITKWSILDAISYFISDIDSSVQLLEPFDSNNLYFQIRIEAPTDTTEALTLDSTTHGFLDQFYLSGPTIGDVNTFLAELIQRVKAAGVDFDILFIIQNEVVKTSNAFIGVIQRYKTSNATIKAKVSFTKTSNAEIV